MSVPTNFHGIPSDELHASCLALGLTMKAKASVVLALAHEQAQHAKEVAAASAASNNGSSSDAPAGDDVSPPTPPPPPAPSSADDNFFVTMHPAITLRPITSCPIRQFEDLQNKQPLWNVLIDMLARHPTFLSEVLHDTAASDEGFTGRMLSMYRDIYLGATSSESGANSSDVVCYQPNMLGIFRNDYMEEASAAPATGSYEHSHNWKQVEINTISVSFAGLAPKVGKFHQQVGHVAKNEVARRRPTALAPEERIHIGESDKVVPGALAAGSQQYISWRRTGLNTTNSAGEDVTNQFIPVVCFVIQENERNTTDQYMLSFEVETAHNVRCIRRTLRELHASLALLELPPLREDGSPKAPPLAIIDGVYEVTVFYFRSCYTPIDFPTEAQWDARRAIEVSAAIKCPSLPYYLCTFKKVQQIITGSRMRADGTPAPVQHSPTATPNSRATNKDFAAAFASAAPSEADHLQLLIERISVANEGFNKVIECGPTGRRRGAAAKPFGASAAHLYLPNSSADYYESIGGGRDGERSAIDSAESFGLTYFSDPQNSTSLTAAAGLASLPAWFTNWIRCNFVPIHSLNPKENAHAEAVIADAIANPRNYVLKPQLEGGGNLYSGDEMVTLLRITKPVGDESALSETQKEFLQTFWRVRNEYILMRRINVKKHSCDEVMGTGRAWSVAASADSGTDGGDASPPPTSALSAVYPVLDDDDASPLFRMGQIISKSQLRAACIGINHQPNDDLCSELGIYGVILSEGEQPDGRRVSLESRGKCTAACDSFASVVHPTRVRILLNDSAGYVIRSKLASVDDGGVMAGAAFLDSIALRNSGSVSV